MTAKQALRSQQNGIDHAFQERNDPLASKAKIPQTENAYSTLRRAAGASSSANATEGEQQSLKVVEQSGVTRTTARRIKSAMEAKDDASLARLLTPTENHAGHPPLLTPDKEVNLVVRIKFAAAHGFSVDRLELKTMASKYVRKKRAMSEDWLPSNEWAVSFRSRNKDIS